MSDAPDNLITTCIDCQKPKAHLTCSECHSALCKLCAKALDESQFAYWPEAKARLSDKLYCQACYEKEVASSLNEYEEILKRAGEVSVFFKEQSKETRLIKRRENIVNVADFEDYDGSIMYMAYKAALVGCNALVDVELKSKKTKISGYTKTLWSGSGRPVKVEERFLNHDRVILKNPN